MKNSTQTTFTKILNFFGLAKASELREANSTIKKLNATIDGNTAATAIIKESYENKKEKIKALENQNDSLREDIQNLETENANKDQKIEKLTKDIEGLKSKSFTKTNTTKNITTTTEENGTEVVKRRRHRGGRRHRKSTTNSEGITTTTNNF